MTALTSITALYRDRESLPLRTRGAEQSRNR